MPIKPVNFQQVIDRSGLLKRDIAKAKGIKPATLSAGSSPEPLDDVG